VLDLDEIDQRVVSMQSTESAAAVTARKGGLPAATDQILGMKRHGETIASRVRHRRRTAVPKIEKLPDPHLRARLSDR
jgi:hypothetical protein